MRKSFLIFTVSLSVLLLFNISAVAGHYSDDWEVYLASHQSDVMVGAIVTMVQQVDLEALQAELYARHADRQEWHEAVVRALQELATESQPGILAQLAELSDRGLVGKYRGLWIGNFILLEATREALDIVVGREDVLKISPDYPLENIQPVRRGDGGPVIAGVENGLTAIRADEVWAMGYTGEGRLVSHLDTGVDGYHPALNSRWRGYDPRYADNPEWAWFDPVSFTTFPFDSGQHGTHTMGTMCGLGEATGDTIGVAFGAEWISAGVIDRVSIPRTVQDALAAFEWITDPDGDPFTVWDVPDVCSNSWGLMTGHGYPPCDETFWAVLDACEAAGVVVLFAAGNEGPGANSLRRPADRATTEITSFSVGALDGNNPSFPIASFSSRGPSYCTPDGNPTYKPEVSAPGVNVRSSVPGGGYEGGWSGTSMACPHVAGVVALIRQANPSLTSEQVREILLETATDLGPAGEDNDYGMGIVDAYEAVILALSYLEGWGTLAGQITDLATGLPIQGASVSVVDRPWHANSRADGSYYLFMPADTLFDIRVENPPTHLPILDQQMVTENETTYVNYALEGKVTVTLTASFANPEWASYRPFYIDGSWDNDGFYDDLWSGDLIEIRDNGVEPDEIAGDGVFTAEVMLARDTEHTYSWAIHSEDYGGEDARLDNGADFNIPDLNPPDVPTLVVNPSGFDNNWVISVEGDNDLSLDLVPGVDSRPEKWGGCDSLYEGITYTFRFHVMHSEVASYGSGGIGGPDLHFTPEIDGPYDFIFDDRNDSYIVQMTGTEGPPTYLSARSGLDHHIPVSWLPPGTVESVEMAYDDGQLMNAYYYYAAENLMATMFLPESYPVVVDSILIHVLTEGDPYWPWPDPVHDPVGISIYLDNGSGFPETDPVFYTEATAELGQWIRVNVDEIEVGDGAFWVAMNNLSDYGPYDGLGIDAYTDYPAHKWAREFGTWMLQDYYTGDHMIRAKVFGGGVETWLGYDGPYPAGQVSPTIEHASNYQLAAGILGDILADGKIDNGTTYYPRLFSQGGLITDTQVLAGYNLYRDTEPNPFDRDLMINAELIVETSYDDWGDDPYGPIVNGVLYYYQGSAVYDIGGGNYVEVGPSNQASATPENHPPNRPYNLVAEAVGNDVNLVWEFNDDIGDFDYFNIYRKLMPFGEWEVVGTSEIESYTDVIEEGQDGTYGYVVTAVDDGEPPLESLPSNTAYALVGHLPPSGLTAISDQDAQVPLRWMLPGSWSTPTPDNPDQTYVFDPIKYKLFNNTEVSDLSMKGQSGPLNPPIILDQGGPDEFGYTWIDSDEPGGPVYEWIDITDVGEQIPMSGDDQNLGPFPIGFDFSFYGETFSTFNICSNGFISFTSTSTEYYNEPIPSYDAPENLVAPFWDDMYPPGGGQYWYYSDGFETVISFIDLPHFSSGGPYTYQIILRSTGTLIFQYEELNSPLNSVTIGIQNGDQTIGLQVVYNADYIHSNMAIRIGTGPEGVPPAHYNLYRSETSPVPLDPEHMLTGTIPGDTTRYIDTDGVENGTTYYYVLTAVWPDSVESPGSNEASATPCEGGHLEANPMEIDTSGYEGEVTVANLNLSNDGGLPVQFNIEAISEAALNTDAPHSGLSTQAKFTRIVDEYDKSQAPPEEHNPPVILDHGGPDEFGYIWIDSDEPGGPEFEWIDISGIGEMLFMYDDDNQGPFPMEFDFPFYGQFFSTFRVCSNGFLSFTSTSTDYSNDPIPSPSSPENLIAPFWEDIAPNNGGMIYWHSNPQRTIVSWVDVPAFDWGYGTGPFTFEVILYPGGMIKYQFLEMYPPLQYCTIGIQDATQTIGLQIAYNQPYVHDELAIIIRAGWLSANPASGTINPGENMDIDVSLDATYLEEGTYTGSIIVHSWDQNHYLPDITIPVTFEVQSQVGIEDASQLLPNEFALEQNYPNPFNAVTRINYALPVDSDVKLEVFNILGQKIVTLIDCKQEAGYKSVIWDGKSASGDIVSSGMYFYKLKAGDKTFLKKMMLLK